MDSQKNSNQSTFFILIIVLFVFAIDTVQAQNGGHHFYNKNGNNGKYLAIKGDVETEKKVKLPYATVYIKELNKGDVTNQDGKFYIRLPKGTFTLCAHVVGYLNYEKTIEVKEEREQYFHIILKEEVVELENVDVVGNAVINQINNTAFNVVAVDTKKMANTTMDVSNVLNKISGVKIKQSGGVGSDTKISLNGFSGKSIKVFMDGVPMEGQGGSMDINKLPANYADYIEVYKGVVPVELGADALGGAINIVTKSQPGKFLDVSYSYGSFNTHKSNVSLGLTTNNGLNYQFTAFQNYSDNSYKVKTTYLNLESNTYSKTKKWFKRFHDTYHNEVVEGKFSVNDKKWVDKLLFQLSAGQEHADVQNSNLMKLVFGGIERSSKNINPSVSYKKKDIIKNLNVSLTGKYNYTETTALDTMARTYTWSGDYEEKSTVGESYFSVSSRKNSNVYGTGNLNYTIKDFNHITLNDVYNYFEKKNNDAAANAETSTAADTMKSTSSKNIIGLSYSFNNPNKKWDAMAFFKYYEQKIVGPVDTSSDTNHEKYFEMEKSSSYSGYGAGGTYKISRLIHLKMSYEKSIRVPSEGELYGDGVFEKGDASIKPERSDNLNLNVILNKTVKDVHNFNVQAGFVYRNIKDYIMRDITDRGYGSYINWANVKTWALDLGVNYSWNNRLYFTGSFTYQDIRNKNKDNQNGASTEIYNDRLKNMPYLFSNTDLSYRLHNVIKNRDKLTLTYSTDFVYKFYDGWQGENTSNVIPGHFTHDLSANYSLKDGRYNVGLEARNITNEIVYDNYSLQKPGRSFSVKLRYYIFKNN